ncbi:MAG: type II toxin-antitoxin system RelE/ParE family toxin [Candidatus Nomurabacteria bacterium]|jgi:mRNA-degrading endonuclease RelE of RelBE toxin-antitoxin system|nr:type II toxin-antitoxin system RelE/ParE family toxin [Candidatus Nomurabacteria bacterium]
MADRLSKFLRKIRGTSRYSEVMAIIEKILADDTESLDVKKLRGHENFFRVRVGKIRIIFEKTPDENIIVDAGFRDDQTYRDF